MDAALHFDIDASGSAPLAFVLSFAGSDGKEKRFRLCFCEQSQLLEEVVKS
jgi:hypothetical protein